MKRMSRSRTVRRALAALFALVMLISCVGCAADDVMKLGRYRVSADTYRYFYENYAASYEEGEVSDELLTRLTEQALRDCYAVFELAKQEKLSLTAEEQQTVSDTYDAYAASYEDEQAFETAMEENNATPEVIRLILEMTYLKDKLYRTLTDEFTGNILSDDATVEADVAEHFVRADQILIACGTDKGEDTRKTAREQAEDLSARLTAGESFDELMAAYNEDDAQPKDGYAFTHGEMLYEVEEAAFALREGEISGVVESPLGFHLIRRLTIDSAYLDAHFEELRTSFITRSFNDQLDAIADGFACRMLAGKPRS